MTVPGNAPDPFAVGVGVLAAIVSGASFGETRRGAAQPARGAAEPRRDAAQPPRAAAAWYDARRALIALTAAIDEFETYVLEDGLGSFAFAPGAARFALTAPDRAYRLRLLDERTLDAAFRLADGLHVVAGILDAADRSALAAPLSAGLRAGGFPDTYADLVARGRAAVRLYAGLLDGVATRAAFEGVVARTA
jgi:hypothetical protein